MTETTAVGGAGAAPGKALHIGLWVLQGFATLAFLGASSAKLLGKPEMVALFETIGVGQWFRYVTGILELSGAVLLLIPKTRSAAAVLLATVMVGAIATHLFILHNAPTAPLVLLGVTSFIAWGRRGELASLLGR
jgi:putative oxidoreductase